jgi:hypothetical protein
MTNTAAQRSCPAAFSDESREMEKYTTTTPTGGIRIRNL